MALAKSVKDLNWGDLPAIHEVDPAIFTTMQGVGAAANHSHLSVQAGPNSAPNPARATSERLVDMIVSRMRANTNPASMGFDWIAAWECKDKVAVFLVVDDKPLVIEDDGALFPSDALVTQLRVLAKSTQ